MLIPFFGLIFDTGQSTGGDMIKTNVLGSYITDNLVQIINEKGKIAGLTAICVLIIVATILKNLFLYLSNRISVPVRSSIITELRGDLYDKILRLPVGYFTEKRKGDLISRMTNDIGEIEGSVVGTFDGLIKDPLTVLGYLIFLVIISPQLSLFLLIQSFLFLTLTINNLLVIALILKQRNIKISGPCEHNFSRYCYKD